MTSSSEKDKFLLSISGSISLLDALDDMAPVFVAASKKDQKKPIGNIENYICFHKELKIGVYSYDEKYFAAQITHARKKWGVYMPTSFLELSEILTDATDDAHLEKASFAGATLFGATTTKEEKAFLSALTNYDALNVETEATELKNKILTKTTPTEDHSPSQPNQEKLNEKKKSDDLFDDI